MNVAFKTLALAAALFAATVSGRAEESPDEIFASVGTGDLTGVYYPVGRAICEIVNRDIRDSHVRCSPESTPGSVYNVDALRSGELEFGIVQSDIAYSAFTGKGAFSGKPFPALRSVFALYPELVTIAARGGIHNIDELKGKRISVGRQGSGTRATWEVIQAALGWKYDQAVQEIDLPDDALADALCNGGIDAAMLVVGHPARRVSALLARCASNLVNVNGPVIDSLVASVPYFRKGRISGNQYGLEGDTVSFGVNAVLMTSASTESKAVAAFANAITSQLNALKAKHSALANLSVEEMVEENLPAPLHPAARKVYKDLGLLK